MICHLPSVNTFNWSMSASPVTGVLPLGLKDKVKVVSYADVPLSRDATTAVSKVLKPFNSQNGADAGVVVVPLSINVTNPATLFVTRFLNSNGTKNAPFKPPTNCLHGSYLPNKVPQLGIFFLFCC